MILKQTESRYLAFSQSESAVVPFEVREGMEGEHTQETDLTMHNQVFMPGVVFMVRVVGLGSKDPEFKSPSAVEIIPGGVVTLPVILPWSAK